MANLDPKSRRTVIEPLNFFTYSKIVASRDLDLILDVRECRIVIRDSAIVADGSIASILSDAAAPEGNNLNFL
ncbi:MAG: hypothetical protein FWF95_01800 [Syntrophorhabdaceae bacterium]|nr:hypothetical protein [Syntrophorhabdaceae bacterium]